MRTEGWNWDGCHYETDKIPLEANESIYVSWAHKYGNILHRDELTIVTRADVYRGARSLTERYSSCNTVKYRKVNTKTGKTKEGFDTFVAIEGRPYGRPSILRREDGTLYHDQPICERTFDTHVQWTDNASVSGKGDSTGKGSRGRLSGGGERHRVSRPR
jgi:hypothetical protein